MGAIASQITSLTIVYSNVYSDADQRKHQSSASLALVLGGHRGPGISPHKRPVTRKIFPFDDVIIASQVLLGHSGQFSQSTTTIKHMWYMWHQLANTISGKGNKGNFGIQEKQAMCMQGHLNDSNVVTLTHEYGSTGTNRVRRIEDFIEKPTVWDNFCWVLRKIFLLYSNLTKSGFGRSWRIMGFFAANGLVLNLR